MTHPFRRRRAAALSAALLLGAAPARAAEGVLQAPADIAWVAMAAALVFFMQAGFALLEGGCTRAKNATNVILKNYADLCFGILAFWAVGYGLMFGANPSGWLGTDGFGFDGADGGEAVFFVYQAMFAATAATIVSGAVAERMRFWPYVLGSIALTALIYPVFGSWVWGGFRGGSGWLADLGFVDFAGSTVVHSVGGWCALAAVLVLGPRLGRFGADGGVRTIPGHNLPMVALGVFILWLGWFGFNGGSTLAAEAAVGTVLMNTQLAAAAGAVGTLAALYLLRRPPAAVAILNGALAGLVAITAGCASMTAPFAVITGLIGGAVAVLGSRFLEALRVDDVVGAVPVHAFAGAWGTLAAGLFHVDGLFDGGRIAIQAIGIGAAFIWTFPAALLLFGLLRGFLSLRASTLHEQHGLDYTEHADIGYPEFQPPGGPSR